MSETQLLVLDDTQRSCGVFDGLALDDRGSREPPVSFLLMRYGKSRFTKGDKVGEYDFAEADADKMLSEFSARERDGVIDYEHQTLTGKQAPAAGWIERLEKTTDGVVAHVKYWTDEAIGFLKAGSYRYFSPVLRMSRRRPMALHSVALTNHPAIHGNPSLVASDDEETANKKATDMETLKKLAALLGIEVVSLDDGIDEAASLVLVETEIAKRAATAEGVTGFLALHEVADLDAMTGKIKGMVPAADLEALNDRLAASDAEKAVGQAFTDRKLVEAQRVWATKYAQKNLTAFNDFVTNQPEVAPKKAANVKVEDGDKDAKTVAFTDIEIEVFKAQGLTDVDIEAMKKDRKKA